MWHEDRHATIGEFWPHYLAAHANPSSRALHFLGTSALGLTVLGSLALEPTHMLVAMLVGALAAVLGAVVVEPRWPAWPIVAAIIGSSVLACPHLMVPGIALGYLFTVIGHRYFEGNQPTSGDYPLWSMLCDVRLFAIMATGRLWWGEPEVARSADARTL